jgi:hypothetical protein
VIFRCFGRAERWQVQQLEILFFMTRLAGCCPPKNTALKIASLPKGVDFIYFESI